MAEVKVLENSVVISGTSFSDCKTEYDKIFDKKKKASGLGAEKLIFTCMRMKKGECIIVLQKKY